MSAEAVQAGFEKELYTPVVKDRSAANRLVFTLWINFFRFDADFLGRFFQVFYIGLEISFDGRGKQEQADNIGDCHRQE